MYLASFIHREELFGLAGRWLCNRLEAEDGLRLTQILICDGFVLGETLERVSPGASCQRSTVKVFLKDGSIGKVNFGTCSARTVMDPRTASGN